MIFDKKPKKEPEVKKKNINRVNKTKIDSVVSNDEILKNSFSSFSQIYKNKQKLLENNQQIKNEIKKLSVNTKKSYQDEIDDDLTPTFKTRNIDIVKKLRSEKKSEDKTKQKNRIIQKNKKSLSMTFVFFFLFFVIIFFTIISLIQYSNKTNKNLFSNFSLENIFSFNKNKNQNSKKTKENSTLTSTSTSSSKNQKVVSEKKSVVKSTEDNRYILPISVRNILAKIIYQPVKKEAFTNLNLNQPTSAVILDVDSGKVLFSKNATENRAIASITKLVTAMVVIDKVKNLDEVVTISEDALKVDGARVGCSTSISCENERLYAGEKVTVRNLLSAMLIASANDAATALAIHVAGSEENFANLMNEKMHKLGIVDSHFCRPSGLEMDEKEKIKSCYSTAYDVSKIMATILTFKKYEVLLDITKTKEKNFYSVDKKTEHILQSTDEILEEMSNILAGKTGFTSRAGYSLAMAFETENKRHKIVCVVLDDDQRFVDIKKMAEWTFKNFEWKFSF